MIKSRHGAWSSTLSRLGYGTIPSIRYSQYVCSMKMDVSVVCSIHTMITGHDSYEVWGGFNSPRLGVWGDSRYSNRRFVSGSALNRILAIVGHIALRTGSGDHRPCAETIATYGLRGGAVGWYKDQYRIVS